MFKIGKVEEGQFYIDKIMEDMDSFAQKKKEEIETRWKNNASTKRKENDEIKLNKRKDLELEKIRFINDKVNDNLRKLHKRFPNFIKVEQIYIDLINTSQTPIKDIKGALSTIMWITQRCDELTQQTETKIKHAKTHETIGFLMKKYLGRVNSLFKKQKEAFATLEEARRYMNKLPTFKNIYTVSIAGFPNVGKSTLMKNITGSDVEIQNYPFTTKGLMFGYITHNEEKAVQLIDTPGLLGRNTNNDIEQRAEIILRGYCNAIVFVLDITQSCGYNLDEQMKLLKKVKSQEKPVIVYLSKTDIYNEEDEEEFETLAPKLKKYKQFSSPEELKEYIMSLQLDSQKQFDPTKVKVIK